MISMPPMYALYIHSILKNRNVSVEYERNINNKKLIEEADYIIMTTSIISHETEINFLNTNIAKNKKNFYFWNIW